MISKLINQKKAQFLPRDFVISLVIFSGLMGLFVLMIASQATDYGNTDIIDSSVQDDFANLSQATDIGSSAFEAASKKGGLSFTGSFDILFDSAFTVISLVFGSIGIVSTQMTKFATLIGIPSVVANIIFPLMISVLTIIIVFSIISITSRRDF
jgi:hypothetical protein